MHIAPPVVCFERQHFINAEASIFTELSAVFDDNMMIIANKEPFMFTNDISCASYYIRIVAPPGVCFEHQYLLIVRLKIFGDRKKCHLLQLYIFSFSALHKL